jgi:hypothetical protein
LIDETALVALLQNEERLAASYRSTELADQQQAAIEYYEAMPFGDEEEGRSQVVSPDVAEVVDYMTISVLRTCISGDRVVEFEAKEEADKDSADEATEAVNYIFMRGQDGYKVLSDFLQSGLVEKIGVIKTSARREVKRRRERVEGVTEDVLAALMDEPIIKVIAVTPSEEGPEEASEGVPLAQGMPGIVPTTYLVDVETTKPIVCFVDMPIPSEEFLFSARMRDVDDIGYKCHKCLKTKSDLVEMGFDREQIEGLPLSFSNISYDIRHTTRWQDEGLLPDTPVPGLEKVWLREEYLNIDLNDDGVAELVQVFRVEGEILSIQEVEQNPFVVFTPFPRAHRMVGNSLADKVMDIQRIRSVILRQTLDGIYLTNNPRTWLPDECQNENTIDDLLAVRPGGIVRGKGSGGKPEPLYEPFQAQNGLAMMEMLVGERESRTGITRLNQGIDADAVNKTATGTALMQAQGQQFEEFIARNFAEAMARLFKKKLRLMIDAGDPVAVKVEGGYKTVDPKTWSDDLDVSIRVGLGSGRKDQRLMYRAQLLQFQQLGMQAQLCGPEHLYRNIAGWIKDAALGNPADFWQDPKAKDAPGPQQSPPDPKMIEAQTRAQAQQSKMQMQAVETQRKAQADQTNAIIKAQSATIQAQQKQQQAELNAQIELRRQDMERELAHEKMMADLAGRAFRLGGSLSD